MPILDAQGRPWRGPTSDPGGSPLMDMALADMTGPPSGTLEMAQDLIKMGVKVSPKGATIPPEALQAIHERRWRKATLPRVPMLPRWTHREVGGAVAKGSGHEAWGITFDRLRTLRERSPIITAIHSATAAKVRRMARRWDGQRHEVGWEVTHRAALRPDGVVPEGFDRWIRGFERFLEEPSPGYCPTLPDLLIPLVEDYLTINRPVAEPLFSHFDGKAIVGWKYVDGALIWTAHDYVDRWMSQNPSVAQRASQEGLSPEQVVDYLSSVLDADLNAARYVLVRDGLPEAWYGEGDLLVGMGHTRSDIRTAGYHPSHVEQAVEIIAAFLGAWSYNTNFFRNGFMPEFAIGVKGELHPQDYQSILDQLREAALGVKRAHVPLVIPLPDGAGLDKVDFKANSRDMMFETWLSCIIALACAVYREDPSSVNAKPWSGGGSASLSEPSRMGEIELARADGLQAILGHLGNHILTPMARRMHPDLVVRWHYGELDAEREARVYEVRTRTDLTPNESRVLKGQAPIPPFWPMDEVEDLSEEDRQKFDANPANWIMNPAYTGAVQQAQMMAQGGGMDGGMPGMEGGDGFGGGGSPFGDATGDFPFGQPGGDDAGAPGGAPPGAGPMEKGQTLEYVAGHGFRWPKERSR